VRRLALGRDNQLPKSEYDDEISSRKLKMTFRNCAACTHGRMHRGVQMLRVVDCMKWTLALKLANCHFSGLALDSPTPHCFSLRHTYPWPSPQPCTCKASLTCNANCRLHQYIAACVQIIVRGGRSSGRAAAGGALLRQRTQQRLASGAQRMQNKQCWMRSGGCVLSFTKVLRTCVQ
jgi:hypothetical protein